MKTCLDYDHYQMLQNDLPADSEYAEDENMGPKLEMSINQLRNDKISIGSLMRVVRS